MSTFKQYPFYTAYTHLNDVYGLELDEDLFETYAIVAWNYIGNKRNRMYKSKIYPVVTETGEYMAKIPCNALMIESITTNDEDFKDTSAISDDIDIENQSIESYNEVFKGNINKLYQSGKLVTYQQVDDTLYFKDPYTELNVLYKGILADDEGLPFISLKEIEAITAYCAYTHLYKKALATMDPNTLLMAQVFEQRWKIKCTQARVPDYINQNEMNEILDAKTSWDRKCYGISYKPVNN